MGEYDEVAASAERMAELAEGIQLAALRSSMSRAEAVARGEQAGRAEGVRRGETGKNLEDRVARAKAYAAWEWDGKPAGGAHLHEFGVASPQLGVKTLAGGDFKKERK